MARTLATYYASAYRTNEGIDHSLLPEPSTIMNAPYFTPAAAHKELSILDTVKDCGLDDLHPIMCQILADFLANPITALYNNTVEKSRSIDARQTSATFSKRGTRRMRTTTALWVELLFCVKYSKNWSKRLYFSFIQRRDPFQRVSMDSFLVDSAYPTLSFRKNV